MVLPWASASRCLCRRSFIKSELSFQCRFVSSDDSVVSPLSSFLDPEAGFKDVEVPRSVRASGMPHRVLVLQPYIKWGPLKGLTSEHTLRLEEAVALVKTLDQWKVTGTKILPLLSFDKKTFFNSGQLEELKEVVRRDSFLSAVFVNVKSLKLLQHLFLENLFGLPVFDRYTIIIQIFKERAVTKEAKLQVSLAEIPYLWSKIKGVQSETPIQSGKTGIGSGETYLQKRLHILNDQERKIKKSIESIRKNRELLRKKRTSLEIPVIAVVGYTNAGKTSLIKCLTEEDSLLPKDQLFATLDVTVHSGYLPGNIKVLFIDTIGFITDIPTKLIEPFIATLEDVFYANVILHVSDASHPNLRAQEAHVLDTLNSFNLEPKVIENIVHVRNKADKCENKTSLSEIPLISCHRGTGLEDLRERLNDAVIKSTGTMKLQMRVANGGPEYQWLRKEAAVSSIDIDESDPQFVFMTLTISKPNFYKFKQLFIYSKA